MIILVLLNVMRGDRMRCQDGMCNLPPDRCQDENIQDLERKRKKIKNDIFGFLLMCKRFVSESKDVEFIDSLLKEITNMDLELF